METNEKSKLNQEYINLRAMQIPLESGWKI